MSNQLSLNDLIKYADEHNLDKDAPIWIQKKDVDINDDMYWDEQTDIADLQHTKTQMYVMIDAKSIDC